MRVRSALLVTSTVGALLAAVHGAPGAGATTPWPSGTIFVAESAQRFGGGHVYAVTPDGAKQALSSGSADDVAVAPDGTVYWVGCDGDVDAYTPGVGVRMVASGFNCPDAIAVAANGDLLVGDYSHLYRIGSDGTNLRMLVDGMTPGGIAVDELDNIYFVDGSGTLAVLPSGTTSPVRVAGLPFAGQYQSLRLGAHSELITALGHGKAVASVPLNGGSATIFGTGYTNEGAITDQAGNIYSSDAVNNPTTRDQVDRIPHAGGTLSLVANGLDTPKGLAIYPAVVPAPRAATSTTLSASLSGTLASWKRVSLAAAVTSSAGSAFGLVQFAVNGNPLGDAVQVRNGVARMTTNLPTGADAVTATYLGSSTRGPSGSASVPFTVRSTATKTVLTTASPMSVPDRSPVDVTATVSAGHGIPGGAVQFRLNGETVQTSALGADGTATATIVMTGDSPKVRAVYTGDEHYSGSSSGQLGFTVTAPFAPTLSTTSSYGATNADGSERVSITLKVRGVSGHDSPSGTVTADQGFTCPALSPVPGADLPTAIAKCTRLVPAGTSETVTVTYGGDSEYSPGTSQESVYVAGV